MPLAGLGQAAKGGAAIALREVADTTKLQLSSISQALNDATKMPVYGLQRVSKRDIRSTARKGQDYLDTKIPKVQASETNGKLVYSFGLYTPEEDPRVYTTFGTGYRQIMRNPHEHKIFSLENNEAFTSVKRIESIAKQFGENWDYSILKASVPSVKDGAKDSTLYAELWTDVASAGENDYMVGGWWLLAPNNPAGDYRFGAFARGENHYHLISPATGSVKPGVIGTATYKGNAAGLHTSLENGMMSIQRLLGKVTLNADFGNASDRGTLKGRIDSLTLNGKSIPGELLFPDVTLASTISRLRSPYVANTVDPKTYIGNINGINYMGDWTGIFQGDSSGTDQPTGIVGVVGGSGEGNSFVASFGAKKVEDE